MELSASYVHISYSSSFFIEYLNDLKDKGTGVNYVGEIFLNVLENSTPDFDQKHIISIVEFLFKQKDNEIKEQARKICNIYGRRGYDFLRKIYDQYPKD